MTGRALDEVIDDARARVAARYGGPPALVKRRIPVTVTSVALALALAAWLGGLIAGALVASASCLLAP